MNKHKFEKSKNSRNKNSTLSLSLSRRLRSLSRKTKIISAISLVLALAVPAIASSVQNIFVGLGRVTDIQVGGQKIEKVVYQGQTLWERWDGTMQSVTHSKCPTTSTPAKDTRDGRYYSIRKLADGRCWMLTNLAYSFADAGEVFRYGAGQADTNATLASETAWNRRNPPYNNQKQITTAAAVSGTSVTLESGTRCPIAYRTSASSLDGTECGMLYNWCAALGNASGNCNIAAVPTPNYTNVGGAGVGLCPTGWRLPTRAEYSQLIASVGSSAAAFTQALNTSNSRSGYFFPGVGLQSVGGDGRFWTSTAYYSANDGDPYGRATAYGYNATAYGVTRFYGNAVRCIKEPPSNISTLSALGVAGNSLLPSFSPSVTLYNLTLSGGPTWASVTIVATASDAKAGVSGAGVHSIHPGLNEFPIVVTAEDGTKTTYTIAITNNSSPALGNLTYLQDLALPINKSSCMNTTNGTRVTLVDRRNGQQYFVQKMAKSSANGVDACWMETNLRYRGDGNWQSIWNYPDDRYATNINNVTPNPNDDIRWLYYRDQYGYPVYTSAELVETVTGQNGCTVDYTHTDAFCGYLYSWCAAMGGQLNACDTTISSTKLDRNVSLCPAGWSMPVVGDYASLYTAVGGSGPAGDVSRKLINNWLGVFGGEYTPNGALQNSGQFGQYWSANNDFLAGLGYVPHYMYMGKTNVTTDMAIADRTTMKSVRCLAR